MADTTMSQPPIYFPPPPTTAAVTDSNKTTPFKINFKTRPGTSDSSASAFTASSFQKPQKQPRPILKHPKSKINSTKRTRQYILLTQLLLSFTILILAVIFAYCAALPHSDNIEGPTASSTASPAQSTTPTSPPLALRDTPLDPKQLDQAVNDARVEDAENNALFSTRSARAALTFYTATLPLLTMAHTTTELLISLVRSETSQHTAIGDVLRSSQQRRITTLVSFTTSSLLAVGWLIMQLFWTNCEINPFLGPAADKGEAVCPVQIRGHRMGGVSQLSVGKVVLGWIVVAVYVSYCAYLYLRVGVFNSKRRVVDLSAGNKMSSFRRRARFERGEPEETEAGRKSVESVVIGIDIEKGVRQ
ncbi:hypothetical protein H2198_007553 [Neophaeococcomyces mojaviensis]|uniref:Uncharacterized protein n=1 Tax=Neophaeococcomyces mojaviensis TaxID=3383035 RepID=A0ACC2ZZS7_9EURO|nr:hypothetical protein H2198_007553 [Knufia sp. JES_112]